MLELNEMCEFLGLPVLLFNSYYVNYHSIKESLASREAQIIYKLSEKCAGTKSSYLIRHNIVNAAKLT